LKFCGGTLQPSGLSLQRIISGPVTPGRKRRLFGVEVSLLGGELALQSVKLFPGFLNGLR
jgi:hypothetical protein